MEKNFIEELKWRGMIHDFMPGSEDLLMKNSTSGYIGFDPTADSLHIGNLVPIMMLVHYQRCGHRPVALVGGATGMVGDPSGKSQERNLLDENTLNHNLAAVEKQLRQFLDFDHPETGAKVVNNYDWFKNMNFLDFIRDTGKHISVNYMMAKDSVKNRLETGLSFTEFSYQLVQGYDFLHLYRTENCMLQMGGSDQWGNITTGTELIRRVESGKAYAITCPLLTKSDGGKFGKTEAGNVWLAREKTSPYQFYQFWIQTSDVDAEKFIKIFTILEKDEINSLIEEHRGSPGARILQKRLAEEVTATVHGAEEIENILLASKILFGKSTKEELSKLTLSQVKEVFSGVPEGSVSLSNLESGVNVVDLMLSSGAFPSKGEARRMIKQGGLKINKEKCADPDLVLTVTHLIQEKYILVSKGKKNHLIYAN